MKKTIFAFAMLIAATAFVACGNAETTETANDSVMVDSVEVVDSAVVEAVDSVAVEAVDSVR